MRHSPFTRALVLCIFAAVALVSLRLPFISPEKPVKGFGYPVAPGEFSTYRVTIRSGEDMAFHTYRVLLVREVATKRGPVLTIEHSETFASDPRSVVQFDIGKREWDLFVRSPAKHPLSPSKIILQKGSDPPTVIESQPALTVLGPKLGFGFHFLENFSIALKDIQPGKPEEVSFGDPPRKVTAVRYKLNYKTEDFYEGELPRRVEATVSGTMLASDEIPFGIVRAELSKSIKRTYEVPGVKAPPEIVRLEVTLILESVGKNGISHLNSPAKAETPSGQPPRNGRPGSSESQRSGKSGK